MNKQAYEHIVGLALSGLSKEARNSSGEPLDKRADYVAPIIAGAVALTALGGSLGYSILSGRRYKNKHIEAAKRTISDMEKKLQELEAAGAGNSVRAKMYADQLSLASDDLRRWEQVSPMTAHYFK